MHSQFVAGLHRVQLPIFQGSHSRHKLQAHTRYEQCSIAGSMPLYKKKHQECHGSTAEHLMCMGCQSRHAGLHGNSAGTVDKRMVMRQHAISAGALINQAITDHSKQLSITWSLSSSCIMGGRAAGEWLSRSMKGSSAQEEELVRPRDTTCGCRWELAFKST